MGKQVVTGDGAEVDVIMRGPSAVVEWNGYHWEKDGPAVRLRSTELDELAGALRGSEVFETRVVAPASPAE